MLEFAPHLHHQHFTYELVEDREQSQLLSIVGFGLGEIKPPDLVAIAATLNNLEPVPVRRNEVK